MKKRIIGTVMAALVTMAVAGMALAADKEQPAKQTRVERERVVTATATVQAVDLEKRVVTLKGAKGNVFDLKVGPQARNLPQVKVGDTVTVKYYESIAYRLLKPGEKPTEPQLAVEAGRTKAGKKPGGVLASEITITATIEAIDKKTNKVTAKGPDGNSFTVKAQDPKNLDLIKVGDNVEITYTEAVAIAVTPAKK
jgi:ABC-type Fe3+-hydroxamate transport system substrate-binding protein